MTLLVAWFGVYVYTNISRLLHSNDQRRIHERLSEREDEERQPFTIRTKTGHADGAQDRDKNQQKQVQGR